jgi:hypothetical protein
MKQETLAKLKGLSHNSDEAIRVNAKDWESLLLDNHQIYLHYSNEPRYLQGVKIGDGVFAVKALPREWDKEFGTIQIEPRTKWITSGKGLILSPSNTI